MIIETIQHILTPARQEVKALGYVREAIAINARYNRCHTAWASHLARCHQNILAATEKLAQGSTLMIIGSGALHDAPMDDLLSANFRLILVDILHLPKVRKKYNNKNQVQFIDCDVTGLTRNLYQKKIISKVHFDLPKSDLVISLNILSQLPLNLKKYAKKNHIPLPENFTQNIMTDHVRHLRTLAPKILLISDLESEPEMAEALLNGKPIIFDTEMPSPHDKWHWIIAPKGELNKDFSISHYVGCWKIGN